MNITALVAANWSSFLGALVLIAFCAMVGLTYWYVHFHKMRRVSDVPEVEGLDGRQIPSMGFDGPFRPGA